VLAVALKYSGWWKWMIYSALIALRMHVMRQEEGFALIATSMMRTKLVVIQEIFCFFTVSFCTIVCDTAFNASLTWPC